MLHNQGTTKDNLVDRILNLLNKLREYIQLNSDANIDAMSLHLTDKKKAIILMSDEEDSSTSNDYNNDLPSDGQISPDDQSRSQFGHTPEVTSRVTTLMPPVLQIRSSVRRHEYVNVPVTQKVILGIFSNVFLFGMYQRINPLRVTVQFMVFH